MKKVLVTGCAGFIGAACCQWLLQRGYEVIGVDNLNAYYQVALKQARLHRLQQHSLFYFYQYTIEDYQRLAQLMSYHQPSMILHLAAQAGVRYSIEHPQAYVDSNLVGFANILELARHYAIKHLVFASSSSVYGDNQKWPYHEQDGVEHPVSLYAATKRSNELMAYSYSYLYHLPITGLRYFTVYGPWGRPDMAPIKFANRIMNEQPIDIYNYGDHSRDFTYIDDIALGTILSLENPPVTREMKPAYALYNIGRGQPVPLMDFIDWLEYYLGKPAHKNKVAKQPGDVDHTWADTSALKAAVDYEPRVSLQQGVEWFAQWYLFHYHQDWFH